MTDPTQPWATPPPPPPGPVGDGRKRPGHRRRNAWLAAGAIALIAVIAAVNSGGNSKSKSTGADATVAPTAASNAPAPDANAPATDAASAPSVAPAVGQFIQWWSQVKADFNSVTNDLTAVGTASGSGDITGLVTACVTLKNDVVTFEADDPSPDAEVRSDLAHAMDYYSTAATECISGDYASSGTDATSGSTWIEKATVRIQTLTP